MWISLCDFPAKMSTIGFYVACMSVCICMSLVSFTKKNDTLTTSPFKNMCASICTDKKTFTADEVVIAVLHKSYEFTLSSDIVWVAFNLLMQSMSAKW